MERLKTFTYLVLKYLRHLLCRFVVEQWSTQLPHGFCSNFRQFCKQILRLKVINHYDPLTASGYCTYHQFNIKKFYKVFHIAFVCCVLISEPTTFALCNIHRLLLYNRGGKRFLRGTSWIFTYDTFRLERLNLRLCNVSGRTPDIFQLFDSKCVAANAMQRDRFKTRISKHWI